MDMREFVRLRALVGGGGGTIEPLNVTANGTYTAPDGVDGYSPVTVAVVPPADAIDTLIDRSITEVTSAVTSIGSYAFDGCSDLITANFPAATTMGQYAFQNCGALATINFPVATQMAQYAFVNCRSLTTADFPAATSVGGNTFRFCRSLITANFPVAGDTGDQAFYGCTSLKNPRFPVATTVGYQSFGNCTSLATADFPAARTVKNYAFDGCSNLTALILRNTSRAATLSNVIAFTGTPIESGTGYIYVPAALVDTYTAASNWSNFAAQFRALEDYTVDGTTTGELDPTKI